MNKICGILFGMLLLSGTVPENNVEAKMIIVEDTTIISDSSNIKVDTLVEKIQTLDSLLVELNDRNYEKNSK